MCHCSDPAARKGSLPSCEARGQHTASSCQLLRGASPLPRAVWPEVMPFPRVGHVISAQRETSYGQSLSRAPHWVGRVWCTWQLDPPFPPAPPPLLLPSRFPQVLISDKLLDPQTPPLLPQSTTCDGNKDSTSFQVQVSA